MDEKVKKDVIYIDVEDDITDIVNKIKESKEKVVALVPPKGVGILRSAINLRLLERTSKKADKRIVLITNNPALRSMSATAKIPVAKTLQSKPEIPEIDILEVDDGDVIEGDKLPISEFSDIEEEKETEMLEDLDIDDNKSFSKKEPEVPKTAKGSKIKIPNFEKFRKKIFVFGGLGVAFVIFMVWAIFFAPSAKIIIRAKTSNVNIREKVNLVASATDIEKSNLALKTEVIEKDSEVSFEATGTKDVGEAASGVLELSQSLEDDPISIKSGTGFSAGGCNFVITSSATVPGAKVRGGAVVAGEKTTVNIRATSIGDQCNLAPQKYVSPIDGVYAYGRQLSGGTKKTIKIVSEQDVNAAKQKLTEANSDEIKNELISKFSDEYHVVKDSFVVSAGEPTVNPAVGAETSDGKAVIKTKTKYSISAINKKDIRSFIEKIAKSKVDTSKEQKLYDDGSKDMVISEYSANSGIPSITITANAKVGPNIDESKLKNQVKGKVFGEVQSKIESIEGVKDVDVKFSYFWVRTIPSDDKKITIEFTVDK